MGQTEWEIEFYVRPGGRCPTTEFLGCLIRQDVVFINKAIKRLERYGRELQRPYVAPLRDGIWELRVRTHHGQYRLFYFFCFSNKFVFTHGIIKKADKVAGSEIDRAAEYKNDYLARHS